MAILHKQKVRVSPYPDVLIRASSLEKASQDTQLLISTMESFGWVVNYPQSNLTPPRPLVFLGMLLDTSAARVFLPQEKRLRLQDRASTLIQARNSSLRQGMRVLGLMVSSMEVVPFAQFHTRSLQRTLLSQWDRSLLSLDREVSISTTTKSSMRWWLNSQRLTVGRSFSPIQWIVITTDASLLGWGGVWETQTVQGLWSIQEKALPINILDLRAVRLSLLH